MFVCETKCAKESLEPEAQLWPWPKSFGPCELCNQVANCLDVPSQMDWAWKHKLGS